MVGNILCLITTLLVFYTVECQKPPEVKESYIAWGEVVQPVADTGDMIVIQTAFEESYDANTQNAAFFLYLAGKNLTFIKNFNTKQTFLYMQLNGTNKQCTETSEMQWMESDFAPGLLSFEDDDGTVKFSINQLLNIPEKYMTKQMKGASTTYRGIPAKTWIYEINTKDENDNKVTLSIQSYWSDGKWNTSAGVGMTPLGFNVTKITYTNPKETYEDYVINVYGFVLDAYDHKYFKPIEGVICASRKQTIPFPNVKDIRAISLHSEMAWPNEREIRYIDTWFDPYNQLVRVDLERLDDKTDENDIFIDKIGKKEKAYQSEIAIGKMEVVFRWGWYKGQSHCEVIPFKNYTNDMQNLFDIKQDLQRWKMGRLFGLNDTSYTYIGQTTKNDVPCHLFQGLRTDWPDKASRFTTLWEWCFNVNMSKSDIVLFQGDDFGLLNVNIWILSDPNNIFHNYRLTHHFYDVKEQDPKVLDSTSFDIGRCFTYKQMRRLQFYLNIGVGDDNKYMFENATSDIEFLRRWKTALYNHTGLPEYSLRISNLRATIDGDKLYIKFSILDVHDSLPLTVKSKQIKAFDAENNLRDNINAEKVSISYAFEKGKTTTVAAAKHSVSFQIDPNVRPRTLPPLPPTTPTGFPTRFPFSLRTEPDDNTRLTTHPTRPNPATDPGNKSRKPVTTTPSTDDEKKGRIEKWIGHKPGAVAGVSIAMLLVGVSIGAGGTFYKSNGLPSCMRR